MLDSISYTNSAGQTISLRSPTIRSNPRAAKTFGYASESGAFYSASKEFPLRLVFVGNSVANDAIQKLLYDVNNSAFGVLEINGWNLRCKVFGVPTIEEDDWGVISLNASFYAPSFRWYRRANNAEWKDLIDGESLTLRANASAEFAFEYSNSESTSFAAYIENVADTKKYINMIYRESASGDPRAVRAESNAVNKKIINKSDPFGAELWDFMSDDSEPFNIVPAGNYSITFAQTNAENCRYRIVEWSEVPPWLTI